MHDSRRYLPMIVVLLLALSLWGLTRVAPVTAGITPTPTPTATSTATPTPTVTPTPFDTPTVRPTETPIPATQEPGPQPSPTPETPLATPTPVPLLPESGVMHSASFWVWGLGGLLCLACGGLMLAGRRT